MFADTISARQTIRVSTSTRQGEREIVRVGLTSRRDQSGARTFVAFRERASVQSQSSSPKRAWNGQSADRSTGELPSSCAN
jgi:hypothetical protein